jgi:hypothetical protein
MYMIYQQYISAILEAYTGNPDVHEHLQHARRSRQWLESLEIDIQLRISLLEPIQMLEETFQTLVDRSK